MVCLNECDCETSIRRRPWHTKGCCTIGGRGGEGREGEDNTKEYNKYLQACLAAEHKMQTAISSRSNPIILHPYSSKIIALLAVQSSSFAMWF